MHDRFREMEIMRGARCVYGPEATYVELPGGGWEEHWHDGGMRGRYPIEFRGAPFERPTPAEMTAAALLSEPWPAPSALTRRPWWRRLFRREQ